MSTEVQQSKPDSWTKRIVLTVMTAGLLAGVVVVALDSLDRPAGSGTLSISAVTGSLTLEPLCDESVTWDLPAGRVGRRSVAPGEPGYMTSAGAVTMMLAAGSRARVTSPDPGVLRVSVEKDDELARRCPSGAHQPYRFVLDGGPTVADPVGFNYESRTGTQTGPNRISLPISGHLIIGQAVPEGADWRARLAPILVTGSILRRVKPWFSHDVLTVGDPERLDEGSIVDSHACLDSGGPGTSPASGCSAEQLAPAIGFIRTLSEGELQVQMYARGPASLQNYRGPQHLVEVPLSTALWESDTVKLWGAFFLLLFACLEQITQVIRETYNLLRKGWDKVINRVPPVHPETQGSGVAREHAPIGGSKPAEPASAIERYHLLEHVKPPDRKKTTR